jgi:integrase
VTIAHIAPTIAQHDADARGCGLVDLTENKTDDPRQWALSYGTAPALHASIAMREAACGERIPQSAPMFANERGERFKDSHLADVLRAHLLKAGINRHELHQKDAKRDRLRAHDLRGTFVTLALVNRATEIEVMDRTGHKSSQMVNRYRRQVRAMESIGLRGLLPLS